MKLLSDDDLDLAEMSDEELAAAWDLWFDLAQTSNDDDPPWTHGVFVGITFPAPDPPSRVGSDGERADAPSTLGIPSSTVDLPRVR